MRRIHGLPGTTYSNPGEREKYRSETHATMTMAELERWIAWKLPDAIGVFTGRLHHLAPLSRLAEHKLVE